MIFAAKSCPIPGRPRNGNVRGTFLFNQKIYYSCDECYKLKGPGYRQCQANQQWTDTQPRCERKYTTAALSCSTIHTSHNAQVNTDQGPVVSSPLSSNGG